MLQILNIAILQWVRNYRKITQVVDSDLSKVALVKNSLVGIDKTTTARLDKISYILDYIKRKYAKEDMVLSLLIAQLKGWPDI